jgi:protein-S-isoprenylcysteine O-methyltransferase Ste14
MKFLEHKIPPPILAILTGFAMWLLANIEPTPGFDFRFRRVVAIVLPLCGFCTAFMAAASFRKAKTTINPRMIEKASSIVTSGVFRYTRNPMYVGLVCLLTGWALYLASVWSLIFPILFVLYITRFQIIPEERMMNAKFGRDYDEYRKRVRRWV